MGCRSILKLAAPARIMGTVRSPNIGSGRSVTPKPPCSRSGGVSICVNTPFFVVFYLPFSSPDIDTCISDDEQFLQRQVAVVCM